VLGRVSSSRIALGIGHYYPARVLRLAIAHGRAELDEAGDLLLLASIVPQPALGGLGLRHGDER
jgi:hypothetical protein